MTGGRVKSLEVIAPGSVVGQRLYSREISFGDQGESERRDFESEGLRKNTSKHLKSVQKGKVTIWLA